MSDTAYYNSKYSGVINDEKSAIAADKGILRYLISVGDINPKHSTSAEHLQRNFFSDQGKNIVSSFGALHFSKDDLESMLQLLELVED